nr:integrase, catalytic region, zinc finger, CCHC-type, peptidase aspartic, catalytic [Tanacetum cinerariifolium]
DEVIATACQNYTIIHLRFNKTPYELINGRKPDISFLHVFGALCYPKNDHEDIGKLGAKGDIGFFIGYSVDSCAYRVFNRRTKKIIETMNVLFDELLAMAFEQRSLKPGLQSMTSRKISSGLDITYALSTITTQQPTEGKSKRASHPPKPVPNSRQRLYLLHMDLCGPMRIDSKNRKRYVLVIVNDYSRYTWVHFLRSKDEAPEVAFRRNACFVRNLEGVDLLKGDRSTNLYTINLHEMATASPICLMARASSTKSWLWHQRQYTRRARIAQSLALPPIADEPASPIGDDSQGEACHTDFGLEAELDRANITKTSTFAKLQRQQDEMASNISAYDLEIVSLKAKIKCLEDRDGGDDDPSREDTTIKGRMLETGEEAGIERSTEKGSNDTKEMVNVLTSLDAASVLSSRVQLSVLPTAEVATISIPPAGEVPTCSDVVPIASPIFTTATVTTPYSRRKGKENMVESETPKKKKLQEQMDMQMARQLEEEMERDAQRMNEQIGKDSKIARIHAEEELQIMIDGLDKNNKTVSKYLQEYEQFVAELSIRERIELISQALQGDDTGRKKEKFDPVWKQIEDFIPISSKEEGERFKRKGLRLEHDSAKKVKISEEVSEEDLKAMMQLVLVKEVYVEALQVKHPIIDWEIQTEGQRSYLKIIRLGGSTACYQFFVDMLKHFDREDLNQLWALVKETLNIRQAANDKENEFGWS